MRDLVGTKIGGSLAAGGKAGRLSFKASSNAARDFGGGVGAGVDVPAKSLNHRTIGRVLFDCDMVNGKSGAEVLSRRSS